MSEHVCSFVCNYAHRAHRPLNVKDVFMQYGKILPISIKETGPATSIIKRDKETGNRLNRASHTSTYNHSEMFLDRCSGMSWADIAIKHNIATAALAKKYLCNSKYITTVPPCEMAKFEG